MNIPFCRMISMHVMRSILKIDVLKMEHAFHMGYKEGDKVFYVSTTIWQGEEALVDFYEEGWDQHQKVAIDEFEVFMRGDPYLSMFSKCMFHVQDESHHLQAWMSFITWVHLDDATWHICINSIFLDTTRGLMELLAAMTNLNK